MFNLENNIHPVLNIDTNQIVLLPVSDAFVIKQGALYYHMSCKMFAITDIAYQEVLQNILTPCEQLPLATQHYFIIQCKEQSDDNLPALSDEGYEMVYRLLKDSGYSTKDMLQNLQSILSSWHEVRPESLLARHGVDNTNMSNAMKIKASVGLLQQEDGLEFENSYDVAGKPMVLYRNKSILRQVI